MASLHDRIGKRNTSYRVSFLLHTIDGPWQRAKTFDTKSDANTFLSIANLIENKSKMNLAPPEEVDLWVKQGYLSIEDARRKSPFFAAPLQGENSIIGKTHQRPVGQRQALEHPFQPPDRGSAEGCADPHEDQWPLERRLLQDGR